MPLLLLLLATLLAITRPALAITPYVTYANDFVDPDYIAAAHYSSNLRGAQETIVQWADELSAYGPWSVTDKPVVAPSGDKHDYMSWAPYQWPDCSKMGNKTEMSPSDVSKKCAYVFRDGRVNPDRSTIQDSISFFNLSDAILYSAIASTFKFEDASLPALMAVNFLSAWFLDEDTAMNPNLNYAQMIRGPTGQMGAYMGILDVRGFTKIASGILIMRKTGNSAWTTEIDSQMVAWVEKYITWLETSSSGKTAARSSNNHGSYFVNQMAALKLIVDDVPAAKTLCQGYFDGIFKNQIKLEAARSRPYHYRNFNIAAMITNARLLKYADPTTDVWNSSGATIQRAMDFLMGTDARDTDEEDVTAEIYPNVAAVAAEYGDPEGKYVKFLRESGFPYAEDASFVWDQPLEGGEEYADGDGERDGAEGDGERKSGGADSSKAEVIAHPIESANSKSPLGEGPMSSTVRKGGAAS
ncbi:chondroitin AC/alginate lyase [Mycena rebaudengoi]|nr:chondroitin AC/alginate lyase [Mycena rebaudengoi]